MNVIRIQERLVQWANWTRADSGIGYPSRTPFDRLRGSSIPEAHITDDVAIRVDAAIGRLRQRCPDQAAVLVEYYLDRRTLAKIARRRRINRHQAALVLRQAETAVDWILEVGRENY